MTKLLEEAVAVVGQLPERDQENIARQVLNHVEKLRTLRKDIEAGIHSLDAGEGSGRVSEKVSHGSGGVVLLRATAKGGQWLA